MPLVLDPSSFSCTDVQTIAFDSHVKCYIDNGFCELVYNFSHPSEELSFINALLHTYDVADFASLIAVKQIYSVMTECPGHEKNVPQMLLRYSSEKAASSIM